MASISSFSHANLNLGVEHVQPHKWDEGRNGWGRLLTPDNLNSLNLNPWIFKNHGNALPRSNPPKRFSDIIYRAQMTEPRALVLFHICRALVEISRVDVAREIENDAIYNPQQTFNSGAGYNSQLSLIASPPSQEPLKFKDVPPSILIDWQRMFQPTPDILFSTFGKFGLRTGISISTLSVLKEVFIMGKPNVSLEEVAQAIYNSSPATKPLYDAMLFYNKSLYAPAAILQDDAPQSAAPTQTVFFVDQRKNLPDDGPSSPASSSSAPRSFKDGKKIDGESLMKDIPQRLFIEVWNKYFTNAEVEKIDSSLKESDVERIIIPKKFSEVWKNMVEAEKIRAPGAHEKTVSEWLKYVQSRAPSSISFVRLWENIDVPQDTADKRGFLVSDLTDDHVWMIIGRADHLEIDEWMDLLRNYKIIFDTGMSDDPFELFQALRHQKPELSLDLMLKRTGVHKDLHELLEQICEGVIIF